MKDVLIRKESWVSWADAVGDYQEIHRDLSKADLEVVNKFGLTEEIAPGMYLASYVQNFFPIQGIKAIKFRPESVVDGDRINVFVSANKLGSSLDYSISKGDVPVCDVMGVRPGFPDGKVPKELGDVVFEYDTNIRSPDVFCFLNSLGYSVRNGNPAMFLVSQAGPALLAFGEAQGIRGGVHATQSFDYHFEYGLGPLRVQVGDYKFRGKEGEGLCTGLLRWIQDDRVVASGKFSVGVSE